MEYNDGTTATTMTYLYNAAGQLTKETQGETNTACVYDANGRRMNVPFFIRDMACAMSTVGGKPA